MVVFRGTSHTVTTPLSVILGTQETSENSWDKFNKTILSVATVCLTVSSSKQLQPCLLLDLGSNQYSFKAYLNFYCRPCDSRNLNTSPFCNLDKRPYPNAWAKDLGEVYENGDGESAKPGYIPDKEASERETYPNEKMKKNELFTQKTLVENTVSC